ncbi:hypothetical protein D9M72_470940 [compost metagenome]
MQLPEKLDDLILGHDLVGELVAGDVPDRLHCPVTIHQADDEIGLGRETVETPGCSVLQHVPELITKDRSMDAYMAAQLQLQLRDAVPG